jgi:hypothetical protein
MAIAELPSRRPAASPHLRSNDGPCDAVQDLQDLIADDALRADLRRLDALYKRLRPYGASDPPPTAEAVSDGVLAAARVAEALEALLREPTPPAE